MNDMYPGPSAHGLIGKQAANLVRGNGTVNIQQATWDVSSTHRPGG
jgi:hypothetical protein